MPPALLTAKGKLKSAKVEFCTCFLLNFANNRAVTGSGDAGSLPPTTQDASTSTDDLTTTKDASTSTSGPAPSSPSGPAPSLPSGPAPSRHSGATEVDSEATTEMDEDEGRVDWVTLAMEED